MPRIKRGSDRRPVSPGRAALLRVRFARRMVSSVKRARLASDLGPADRAAWSVPPASSLSSWRGRSARAARCSAPPCEPVASRCSTLPLDKRARGSQEEKDSPSGRRCQADQGRDPPRHRRGAGPAAASAHRRRGSGSRQPLVDRDEDAQATPRSRGTADEARSAGRRRDKDFSNSARLLATVEGESAYLGHVRGANGGRWMVI